MFVALAAITAREIWRAFDARAGQARAAAVFDLVATRTAMRPTDAPGAMAWLRRAVERAGFFDRSLSDPADGVPSQFLRVAPLLDANLHGDGAPDTELLAVPERGHSIGSVRFEQFVKFGPRMLVVTRRRALADDRTNTNFIRRAANTLMTIDFLLRPHPPEPRAPIDQPGMRVVRVYALYEDGTLLSLPWTEAPAQSSEVAGRELEVLAGRPTLPAFAPDDFFFRSTSASYSGFYLDLGGRGLVATLTKPVVFTGFGRSVLAIDFAFDVDWSKLAESLEVPVRGAAIDLPDGAAASWDVLASAAPQATNPDLVRALRDAASQARTSSANDEGAPIRQAVVEAGALAAFHVADRTWLLAWFPQVAPAFPFGAVALLSGLLVLLLTGFEVNRRRAYREQRAAERALQEKQNLLNTMQVPLVVVDPNTDAIVSANRAADDVGFSAGRRFADLVWPDDRSRAHYQRMQIATPEPRRAYGVPVSARSADGKVERRYAIVRSVAVTAPIEALHADERHRLGVLIVVDESADLALLLEDAVGAAHQDERRRLSGLLSHGVDSIARVLEYSLSRAHDPALTAWLAEYLERRIGVTSWLLDHWDATPPLPRESLIDARQARATIDRLEAVLAMAAAHLDLRQRLHWDNGTLSAPGARILDVQLDWPDDIVVTCPVHGGFGLFISELITNAIKHGRPGSVPSLTISCDLVRGELRGAMANDVPGSGSNLAHVEAYGGVSILKAMSRLFEWGGLSFDRTDSGRFVVSWTMPFSTRRGAEAD